MNKIYTFIFVLLYSSSVFAGAIGPGASWQYVRKITLSPTTPVANYQVKVTLTAGQYTNMKADGSDLRFYDNNNNSCNYWIEKWNTSGTSIIWVKAPVSGSSALYLFYGNSGASAVSNGSGVFDFFDDFPGSSLGGNWSTITSGGTIGVSGSWVTLSNTNGGTVDMASAFTPASTSFYVEAKHNEGAYSRNRFYATTILSGWSPTGFDFGYFTNGTAQIYWNGIWSGATVTANTDYLTRWQITDGSTYNWSNYVYSSMSQVDVTRTTTVASNIRYIRIAVTETASTSTKVDWVRVRKYAASEPVATVGSANNNNLAAGIASQTNVICYGQSTGSAMADVTGGTTPYTYQWSNSQTGITATGLTAGTYSYTVTESGIGLQATTSVTITQPAAPTASNNGPLCVGETLNLSASSGVSYSWNGPNGFTSSIQNPSISNVTTAMSGSYSVTITDNNGCTNTTSTTVTVNPLPTITASGSAATVCYSVGSQNSTLAYSATTNSPTHYTITWDAAAHAAGLQDLGSTALPASPVSVPIAAGVTAGTYNGTLRVINANSCVSAGNSFTVTINPAPIINSAATGTICSGQDQNYTITSAMLATYSWSRAAVTGISNAAVSGQTNNPITESLVNTTNAPVAVTYLITPTGSGCTGPVFSYVVTVSPALIWYNSNWIYRKAITIDHTKVPNTNQSNFPVLVSLTSDAGLSSHALSNGNDILFTSSDGITKIPYQRENYTGGTLNAWVKVPVVSSTQNTVIYMYYGNPNASDQQDAANVWDANYAGVYHVNESGTGAAGEYKESKSGTVNGTVKDNVMKAIFNMQSAGNAYCYQDLTGVSDYTIQSGDVLIYDVYWTSSNDIIAFDFTTTGGPLRDKGATDQNGISSHPAWSVSAYALNQWYHREIPIPASLAGTTIQQYDVACEFDGTATKTAYLNNIYIRNSGGTISKVIYSDNSSVANSNHLINPVGITSSITIVQDLTARSTGGKINNSLNSDGARYLNMSSRITTATDNFTLEAWVKPNVLSQNGYFLYNGKKSNGFGLGIGNGTGSMGSKLVGQYGGVAWIPSAYTFPSANTWYHVAMVRASGTTSFYVNGAHYSATSGGSSTPTSPNDQFTIGALINGSNPIEYFNGPIDEVRISNSVRSADWLATEYNNQSSPSTFYTISGEQTMPAASQATAICSGNTFTVTPSGMPVGITYTWTAPTINPAASITGSGAENTGQPSISQTLTNTIASPATATYTVTPTLGSCPSGSTFPLIVTVNPLPSPTVTASGVTTFCQGNSVTLNPSIGTALSLNGTNQYAITPDLTSSFSTSTVTIELWFKANGAGVILSELGQSTPNSGWHDSWIEILSTGEVKARVWNLTSVSLGTVSFGTWNHAVIRYNGTNVVGFLNGVISSAVAGTRITPPINGTAPNNKQYWAVGSNDGTHLGSGAWFNGQVDEMRIWNVARTNTQITGAWNKTIPTNSSGLVAYYKMDEGSGATLTDASGNGKNASLVNSPSWINPSTAPIGYYASYLWSPGGVTTSSNTINASGNYTINVTDVNGCSITTSATTVTVNPIPVATASNNNQSVCSGNSIAPIVLGTSNNVTGTTFNWTRTTPGGITGTVPVSATGSIADITGTLSNSTSSSINVTFTITPYGPATTNCQGSSITATVAVNPTSVGGSVSGTSTICYNTNKTLNLSGHTGSILKWQSSIDNGSTWSDIVNTTASYNAVNLVTTTQFRAVIQSGVCPAANSTAATVTVNPPPSPIISTDYCGIDGNVVLTSSVFNSYQWNTGETTRIITVDLAGIYSVTVTDALGCTGENAVTVANELVTDGSFTNFNPNSPTFTSGYTNHQSPDGQTGLVPEGLFAVNTNANAYHNLFFGTDHTNPGTGKFMMVNGDKSSSYPIVWSQNITVQPYTDYYFSAFAISLNQVPPYAQLQFKVNGEQVGTVAMLNQGAASNAGPFNWVRFYGTWNSGPITSTTLSIVDLQTMASGNDFGLDDISCSTLAPITFSIAPAGLNSLVCEGDNIELAANVSGGKPAYTYSWTGPNSFTSSNQNPSISNATTASDGIYYLTVTNGYGCSATNSTTITIGALPSDKTVTANASSLCAGTATTIKVASSQSGVKYQLRNDADDSNIGSAVSGNGSDITLSTGNLSANTTFNVLATNSTTFCSRQLTNIPAVTIDLTPVLVITNQAACSGTVDLTSAGVTAGSTGGGALSYWTDAGATNSLSNPNAVATSGTYYIKSTVSSCSDIEPVTVVISAAPNATFSYTGTPYCNNSSNPFPTYSGGGAAGTFSSTSGLVFVSTSTGQIDLAASTPGTYTVTNSITPTCGSGNASKTSSVTITQLPSAEFNYGTNSLCQNASGSNPYPTFVNGGVAGTFTSSYGLNIISPSTGQINILGSTPGNYMVLNSIAAAAGCPAVQDTAFININPYSFTGSVSASSSDDTICKGQSIDLSSSSTQYLSALLREGFNGGPGNWTTSNSSTGGTPANAKWTLRGDGYQYTISGTPTTFTSNDNSQFYLSNSHAQGGGTTLTTLKSPEMSTMGYTSLAVDFFQYFRSNNSGDTARVEVSLNGSSWTTVATYTTTKGAVIGITGTIFENSVIDLSAYINKPKFYIRFRYKATNDFFWAIDNVSVTGNSTTYAYNWNSTPAGFSSSSQNPTGVSPISNTSYTVVATNTYGCTSSTNPVAITVNPIPLDNAGSDNAVCSGSSTTIGASSANGRTYSWSPAATLNNATLSNPTATPIVTTTYTLTETITATGCSAANEVVITANPLPADKTVTPVASVVCEGGSTSIQVFNSEQGVSYQLRDDADDFNIGSAVTGNSNTILLPTVAINSNTTYNILATMVSPNTGCTAQMAVTPTVSIASPGMWVGLSNNNWNDANNWCDAVPTSTKDVVIPAGTPYSPVISADAVCRNLTINSGNSLTITLGGNLSLYGNLTVNGTYTHTAGLLQLTGSSNQSIDGISAFDVNVNTDNTVTLNNNLTVTGTLTLTKGVVVTGTKSVVISNSASNSVHAGSGNTNYTVSWIKGNITRSFASSTENSYDFPVGTATKGRLATVKSNYLTGISSITAYFKDGPVETGGNNNNQYLNAWETGLPANPYHTPYTSIRNEGTWMIEPNAQPTNQTTYDIRLYFNGFNSPVLHDNMFGILKRPSNSLTFADFKPGGGTINGNNGAGRLVSDGYALRMGLASFSEFGIGESGTLLPIELVSFTVEKCNNGKDVLLKWNTATEVNNDHFEIEVAKTIYGDETLSFVKIGEVKGNGTSTIGHSYSFIDEELNKTSVRYYRLRQMDFDGSESYSPIRAVTFGKGVLQVSALYPNPVSDVLNYSLTSDHEQEITISITNVLGQEIFYQTMQIDNGINTLNFNVNQLSQGIYFLNITDDTKNEVHKKFEKF